MSIIWKPNGQLNVALEGTDLPETVSGISSIYSEALKRCKNLRIDITGKLQTRDGSSKFNSSALNQTAIYRIIEQGGDRYTFAGTRLFKNEEGIKSGLTSAEWSAILYNSYNSTIQNIFALNGTDRKRIENSSVYEWGITAPSTAPALAVGASTGLTGDYNAKYTYARKENSTVVCESDPSPAASSAQTLSDESLSVTPTQPTDSQVTHIRVYRTLADGEIYYHDSDIAVGTTTLDTDTADSALGSEVATDHDRPPLGTVVIGPNYDGTCFILKDNLLYYCLPKQPEYWPLTYFVEISPPQQPCKAAVFYNGQLYILTKYRMYYVQGTGASSFFPIAMNSITGAPNQNGAIAVQGHGIYHVGNDGIYLWAAADQKITQEQFEPLFRGEDANGMPGISSIDNSWLIQFRNQLYFGYTSSGYSYPTNVIVWNLTNKRASYYTWDREIRTVAIDETNDRLLAGDNSGYIWQLENSDENDDDGTEIEWEAESKDFTLQTRRHFPRYAKYDVDASNDDCTATGYIMLDGSSHQSHSIIEDRNVKKRLVTGGNGKRMSFKVAGSGPVEIYAVEAE